MLAGINGTILAIALAVATGYLFIYFGALEGMKNKLTEEANYINYLRFPLTLGGCNKPDPSTAQERVKDLIWGGSEKRHDLIGERAGNPDSMARELGVAVSEVIHSYPFLTTPEAGLRDQIPVELYSEDQVRAWFPDLVEAMKCLSEFKRVTTDEDLKSVMGIDVDHQQLEELREALEPFLKRALQIRNKVNHEVGKLDRYRKRLPSRGWLAAISAVTVAVFFCGVFLPMIDADTPTVLSAWIPGCAYLLSLIVGGALLWRFRGPNETR